MRDRVFIIKIDKHRMLSIQPKNIITIKDKDEINLCQLPHLVYMELLNLKNKNVITPILSFKHIPYINNNFKNYNPENKNNQKIINKYIMNIYFSNNRRISISFIEDIKYAFVAYEQISKNIEESIVIKIPDKTVTKEKFCINKTLSDMFELKLKERYIMKSKNIFVM